MLTNYPRRVDVWSVYLDMELRHAAEGDVDGGASGGDARVRQLFERVTSLRLSTKKSKFFFKRYLAYAREVRPPPSLCTPALRAPPSPLPCRTDWRRSAR